jgi:hypothetical protein
MPGTARLSLAALAVALLAFTAPLTQHHAPGVVVGAPVTVAGTIPCANCI